MPPKTEIYNIVKRQVIGFIAQKCVNWRVLFLGERQIQIIEQLIPTHTEFYVQLQKCFYFEGWVEINKTSQANYLIFVLP